METHYVILSIVGAVVILLAMPWVICFLNKPTSPVVRYLDWVYNVVNRKDM